MLKSKHLIYPTIFVLCLSLVGCAAMQRKFARRKKEKEEKHAPIIVKTFDYSKDLRVDELYKRHFLFWQSWHSELIDRMDSSYKKRSECYAHIISSLSEMNKYLNATKANELDSFMTELGAIDSDIREKKLSKSAKNRMKRVLRHTKREIDREFSYSKVKEFLELRVK